MKISENIFRRILREEALRTRIFEAVAAPPPAAPAAPAAGNAPLEQLTADLRNIMFGNDGVGGESSLANNKTAMLWSDMVLDMAAGLGGGESDDGDLARLPEPVKEKILDDTINKIKMRQLDKDSFYEIVSSNYANTFSDLDPPAQDDALTRPGTNTYWPYVHAAALKYQKAVGAVGAAGAAGAAGGSSYTVVRGDTLSQIALRFYRNGTPAAYQALGAANGLKPPYGLVPNQKITLPPALNLAGGKALQLVANAPQSTGATGNLSESRTRISIVWGR